TTYYNNVGESYQALSQFYQIAASNTLIVADELALPFGTVRTREGGSAAGNNGIKSIIAHHGEATKRIRIGIWNQLVAERDAADFVLSAFSAEERERLPTIEEKVLEYIEAFCDDTFEATTHQAA
ncbi:MAG TPA: aminoacyl-tRNA hydrolase, partial [Patescibacteria group bacterium]|nr:aminoacyl-tRNA hydrolase [Patescibacteria group bacterium]